MSKIKVQAERINVIDQVGKQHVIVKYIEPAEPPLGDASALVEYRLGNGRVVLRTGTYTFQSVDGRLHFQVV